MLFIRIDDYPTGVRPILPDHIERLGAVLKKFEDHKVPYLLGVVPELLEGKDYDYLRSLKYATIAMHGCDHLYGRWKDGDPDNEFIGMPRPEVERRVTSALSKISEWSPQIYIPPFNTVTNELLDVLHEKGIELICTSEYTGYERFSSAYKMREARTLTPLYGRTPELVDIIRQNWQVLMQSDYSIGLHVTWEDDEVVSGRSAIDEFLKLVGPHTASWNGLVSAKQPEVKAAQAAKPAKAKPAKAAKATKVAKAKASDASKPIKVLHITEQLSKGGAGRSMIAIAKYSSRMGNFQHKAISIAPGRDGVDTEGLEVLQGPSFETICAEIEKADVVQWHWWEDIPLMREKLPKHFALVVSHTSGNRWPHQLTQPDIDFADHIVAVCDYSLQLPVFKNIDPNKLSMIYMGADYERILPIEKIPHEGFTVGWVGTIDDNRYPTDFLQVHNGIQVPDIKMLMVGMGPMWLQVRNEIQTLGLTDKFKMLGYRDNMRDVFGRMDVYGLQLNPDTTATSELNLQEAMVAEVPPVMLPIGGPQYVVENGVSGIVAANIKEYQQAIEHLYNNPDDRQRMGENARRRALEHFGAEKTAKQFNELYCKITKRDNASVETTAVNSKSTSKEAKSSDYRVSAIVSTYNSERFIRGCLDDLIAQTLYQKGELEIVVVNTGSQQNEFAIVEEYKKSHDHIKHIHIPERETIYGAWNRGIKAASGKYVTNANTDDRHRVDALEQIASVLDSKSDIALTYADVDITEMENATFGAAPIKGRFQWLEFDRETMFQGCYMGPQPMWRRELHDRYGYFDDTMKSSGDYDFWLRMCATEKYLHIPEVMGLYLDSPASIEHANQEIAARETQIARERNQPKQQQIRVSSMAASVPDSCGTPDAEALNTQALALADRGDNKGARKLLWKALEANSNFAPAYLNLAALLAKDGHALEAADNASRAMELNSSDPEAYDMLKNVQTLLISLKSSPKSKSKGKKSMAKVGPTQAELDVRLKRINTLLDRATTSGNSSAASKGKPSLSLCMIVRDEEAYIEDCLKSVKDIVSEMVVVDTGSKDRTVEIAKSYGASVYTHKWTGSFSDARNEALKHAKSDWVLFLDADERLDKNSISLILQAVTKPNADSYDLTVCNYLTEGNSPDVEISVCCRLMRNKPEYRYEGSVHERVLPSVVASGGAVGRCQAVIYHHGYKPTVMKERNKHSKYMKLLRQELEKNPNDVYYLHHLGAQLFSHKDYEEAADVLKHASEALPHGHTFGPLIYSRLAESLLMAGRKEEALAAIQRAQTLGIGHPQLSHSAGNVFRCMERYEEAAASYEKAINLGKQGLWVGDPATSGYKAEYGLAAASLAMGDYSTAIEYARRANRNRPGNTEIEKLLKQAETVAKENKNQTSAKKSPARKNANPTDTKLSLCMIVRNEEQFLQQCLESAKKVVDEMIIVDTGSTDRTVEIAKSFGAKIYSFPWNDNYSDARNESLSHATGDWILVLDADEQIDPSTAHLIRQEIKQPQADGYNLRFKNVMTDGENPDITTHQVCRLFRNRPEHRYTSSIHEHIEDHIVSHGGFVTSLEVLILHFGYKASVVTERGKHEKYVRMLEAEIKNKPDDIFYLHHLSSALCAGYEFSKAVPYLEHACDIVTPDNIFANMVFSHLVNALRELGRHQEGLDWTERAEKLGIVYPQLSFCKGNVLTGLQRFEEAITAYKEAIRLGRGTAWTGDYGTAGYKADFGIAHAYLCLGNYDQAIEHSLNTLKQKPGNPAALELLCKIYTIKGDQHLQEKYLLELTSAVPGDTKPIIALAELYEAEGRLAEAMQRYETLIHLGEETAVLRLKLGSLAEASNEPKIAEEHYVQATRLGKHPEPYNALGMLLASQERFPDAISCFTKAIELDATFANAFFNAGDVFYATGNYQQAADTYQNGLSHNPNHAAAFLRLGNCYCQMGVFAAAVMAYEQALSIQPEYDEATNNLQLAQEMLNTKKAA